jgi:hypothetical protein
MPTLSAALLMRVEVALLIGLGLFLVALPTFTIRLLGMPPAPPFWPRLLGSTWLGLALAILAQDLRWTATGLGLGGVIAVNLVTGFALISMLAIGAPMPTRRGRLLAWLLAALFTALGFTQIAFAT